MKSNKRLRRDVPAQWVPNKLATAVAGALMVGFMPVAVYALPTDGKVMGGQGQVGDPVNGSLVVNQQSQKLAIDWLSFGIAARESVQFVQPGASAIALNRVLGQDSSQILGSLSANGQVFILNPNGVLFGAGAQVNVGGIVASTLDLSTADFLAGRTTFTGGASAGSVVNQGSITAANGGYVALLGPQIRNEGTITATLGTVALAAGNQVTLNLNGNSLVSINVDQGALNALAENKQLIRADGGWVLLTAKAADALIRSVVNNDGVIEANTLTDVKGTIRLEGGLVQQSGSVRASGGAAQGGDIAVAGDVVLQTGAMRADGASGGSVALSGRNVLQAAPVSADGSAGAGGSVSVTAEGIIQTSGATLSANGNGGAGGSVTITGGAAAGGWIFSSAGINATGESGGNVTLTAHDIVLRGANLDASGEFGGGTVLVGGDWQGMNPAVANAATTQVNFSTSIKADALQFGDGGKVVVRSDQNTRFFGTVSARGGVQAGNGGRIEVSGTEAFVFGGMADAGAPHGAAGSLLLDPKNITIGDAGSGSGPSTTDLVDPHIGANDNFGAGAVVLTNGNIVAPDPNESFVNTRAGAVYLFSGTTGALVSTLTGSTSNDQVSSGGVTALAGTAGNYVVSSPVWNNGLAAPEAGAATFGSGTSGVSGAVSATNSLVGSNTNDHVSSGGVTALAGTAGNYVVSSPNWSSDVATAAGAATFGKGDTGVSGPVSTDNSLVGSKTNDHVGSGGVTALTGTAGNYVVKSPLWSNGSATEAGAATFGRGDTGVSGPVNSDNSLVGSTSGDKVSFGGVTALTNGNYVVSSPSWTSTDSNGNPVATAVGAATFGKVNTGVSGDTGVSGAVTPDNSLVGTATGDAVGIGGVTALTGTAGNYVVSSPFWNGTAMQVGAATFGNGDIGVKGEVSAVNSLVGTSSFDTVSSNGITALANGNYAVISPNWTDTSLSSGAAVGAVTFGDGAAGGATGPVTKLNSLVGSTLGDSVGIGGVTALSNGNFVVSSRNWDDPVSKVRNVGAATFVNVLAGTVTGTVGPDNSLVGTTANDQVSRGGVAALTNDNYVVSSPNWDNPVGTVIADVGAVTFGKGDTGVIGTVSTTNSLVGTTANDRVGSGVVVNGVIVGVTALANGNYVVNSPNWNNGAATAAGAVTLVKVTDSGIGTVSDANSLVGSTLDDHVGSGGVTVLANGNFMVSSPLWDNPVSKVIDVGAVTFGSGTAGLNGPVTAANSLMGVSEGDQLGSGGISAISGDRVLVRSPLFDNGALDSGRLQIFDGGGSASPFTNPLLFADRPSEDVTITPAQITAILNTGTEVKLQANNDITVNNLIQSNDLSEGALIMQAGRSILANAGIATGNGNLTLIANETLANGVVDAQRDPGNAVIAMAPGASIHAGTGAVKIELRDGAGKTNNASGDVTLDSITAGRISVVNNGPGAGNVVIGLGSTLTASGAGDALVLAAASGGNFVNNSGSAALSAVNGRWLVYSTSPFGSFENGLTGVAGLSATLPRLYNRTYAGNAPVTILEPGNHLIYSFQPTLTVTADDKTRFVHKRNPVLTATFSGFVSDDGVTDNEISAGLTGAPSLATTAVKKSPVGTYPITAAQGTLASGAGYAFAFVNGKLTVIKRVEREDEHEDEHEHRHRHRHHDRDKHDDGKHDKDKHESNPPKEADQSDHSTKLVSASGTGVKLPNKPKR